MKVPKLPPVKVTKESYGANIILGIEGKQEDINTYFNFLVNYGGTPRDAGLEWVHNKFAKVQLDEKGLFTAYQTYLFLCLTENEQWNEREAENAAKSQTKKILEDFNRDYFLTSRGVINIAGW